MIRINTMVKRDSIYDLMDDPGIARISFNYRKNKDLHDRTVCKVSLYIEMDRNFARLFRSISKIESNMDSGENKKFLRSMISRKAQGWLKISEILKLKEIEDIEGVDFRIGGQVFNLIEKYKGYE